MVLRATMTDCLLRMSGINKVFPGVQALDNVSLEVAAGEIHALLGENGAGKSTLLKILSGSEQPDAGVIELDGIPVKLARPHDATHRGIVTIYQEFTLLPEMTIAENVFIGREPGTGPFVNWSSMASGTTAILDQLGLHLKPTTLVRDLNVAEQQMIEIARALSMKSRLIVMDEPTSALSSTEVQKLYQIVRNLRAQGLGIIFVTHRLEEVMDICDRYTVLRDGKPAGAGAVADVTTDDIIRLMVGRDVNALFSRRQSTNAGRIALQVKGLSRRGNAQDPHATVLEGVDLSVREGEILGIAGLVGAGRTELARAIFGADPFDSGKVLVAGVPAEISNPQDAIRHGVGLVPEDRKQQALFLSLSVRQNLSLVVLSRLSRWRYFVDERAESQLVEEYQKSLNIRFATPEQSVMNLSGGNQQKVVLARWLALRPRVLIVDEPTRGIDVGAKIEVHNLLFQMAAAGVAVIAISSELPEILTISDRIVTMREGRVTGEVSRDDATEETLMKMMTISGAEAGRTANRVSTN
jgi:inositol transport system ATP-binding protein